jgi:hypothetical protein
MKHEDDEREQGSKGNEKDELIQAGPAFQRSMPFGTTQLTWCTPWCHQMPLEVKLAAVQLSPCGAVLGHAWAWAAETRNVTRDVSRGNP